MGGLTAWCVLIAAYPAHSITGHEQLPNLARTLSSGLFLVAGVLYLARGRLTDELRTAQFATALLVFGATVPAVAAIGPLLHEPHDMAQTAASTRALFLIPVFMLLLRATSAACHHSSVALSARRFTLEAATASGLGLAVALAARRLGGDGEGRALGVLIAIGTACWWLLVAQRTSRGTRGTTGRPAHLATGFILLATAELVRAWSIAGASPAIGVAAGFQLAAAMLIAYAAARSLWRAHRADASQSAELARAVVHLRGHLEELEAAQRERLHDARSAVVGVLGASELLSREGSAIAPDRLRGLMAAELSRLQAMLDAHSSEPISAFDLAPILAPVIVVRQLQGCDVDSDVADVRVVGRPGATATVLDNLLTNALVHAPGARIWIRTERLGTTVRVVVEDDGPGILPDEQGRVLRRGVRGSSATAPGDGLGLYTSVMAMQAQGGSLELDDRPTGGTRVTFALPEALPVAPHALAS
ncbi:MAG TPA: HAMP domain-containing sensor histidine kinase [Jatrophihabitans sp.]|nr:HAMP domain-containing sensor histidine kinase [Jatrophihabitans sp.]